MMKLQLLFCEQLFRDRLFQLIFRPLKIIIPFERSLKYDQLEGGYELALACDDMQRVINHAESIKYLEVANQMVLCFFFREAIISFWTRGSKRA